MNILGDEDEASQWKESYGSSDIIVQNEDESDQEVETQEIEVRIIIQILELQTIIGTLKIDLGIFIQLTIASM